MKSFIIMILLFAAVLYVDHIFSLHEIQQEQKIQKEKLDTKKLTQEQEPKQLHKEKVLKKKHSISNKKKRFFALVVPAIENIHKKQEAQFLRVKTALDANVSTNEILTLKQRYRVTTDKNLLLALKPHPQSIVIAQAAIESAWGTSRFFREANNIFGMWSKNPNEPRIAARVKRDGNKTIWLRKFTTLDESIEQYYRTIGRVKHYKEFRELRYKTDDVNLLVKKLDKYSELGDKYTRILANVIKHNNLTKYDK